jgi:hypothetical protein
VKREARVGQAFREQRADLSPERLGGIGACAGKHDDELVATQARRDCAVRQDAGQRVGNLA